MASSNVSDTPQPARPAQPVIVNSVLENHDVTKQLQRDPQVKVRVTDTTVGGSIIFPRSGVAFMYLPVTPPLEQSQNPARYNHLDPELLQRIDKMRQVHRQFYILPVAALHGDKEMAVFSSLQQHYFGMGVYMIPCHHAAEAVQIMTDMAKMTGRTEPLSVLLKERIDNSLRIHPDPSLLLQVT